MQDWKRVGLSLTHSQSPTHAILQLWVESTWFLLPPTIWWIFGLVNFPPSQRFAPAHLVGNSPTAAPKSWPFLCGWSIALGHEVTARERTNSGPEIEGKSKVKKVKKVNTVKTLVRAAVVLLFFNFGAKKNSGLHPMLQCLALAWQ